MRWPTLLTFVPFALLLVGWPSPAQASPGLPIILLMGPAMLAALIPIIIAESFFLGRAMRDISKQRALGISTLANAISTLVGVPLVWGLWLLVDVVTARVQPTGHGWFGKVCMVLLGGAWLEDEHALYWSFPTACILLLVGCFVIAYPSEWFIVRRMVPPTAAQAARKAVWRANVATYGALLVLAVGYLIYTVNKYGPWHADDEPPGGTLPAPTQIGALDLDDESGRHDLLDLSFSPDGALLAVVDGRDWQIPGAGNGDVQIWDMRNHTWIITVSNVPAKRSPSYRQLTWGPQGAYVLVLGETVTCIDPRGGQACAKVPALAASGGAFNGNQTRFVAFDPNNTLTFYNTADWQVTSTARVEDAVQDVAWTQNEKIAVLAVAHGDVDTLVLTMVDPTGVASPQQHRLIKGLRHPFPTFTANAPDQRSAVARSRDVAMQINFEQPDKPLHVSLPTPTVAVESAAYCNDATLLLQYMARLHHPLPERGRSLATVARADGKELGWAVSSGHHVAVSPATHRMATSKGSRVRLYDLSSIKACSP